MCRPPQDVDVLAVLDFQIPCSGPEPPGCHSSSPSTKAMNENQEVRDDYQDGNEGLKDPERRGRRRPEEPWPTLIRFNFET